MSLNQGIKSMLDSTSLRSALFASILTLVQILPGIASAGECVAKTQKIGGDWTSVDVKVKNKSTNAYWTTVTEYKKNKDKTQTLMNKKQVDPSEKEGGRSDNVITSDFETKLWNSIDSTVTTCLFSVERQYRNNNTRYRTVFTPGSCPTSDTYAVITCEKNFNHKKDRWEVVYNLADK